MTIRATGWALLVQSGLMFAAYAVVRPMMSYRAIELHAGSAQIGLLSASFSVLPLVLAFAVGRQADRFGPLRLILVGSALFTVAGVLGVLATNLALLLVSSALLGLGQLVSLVGQQSAVAVGRPDDRTRAFGTLTSAGAVGQILGPVLATLAVIRLGGDGGWTQADIGIVVATVLAVLSLPLCWLLVSSESKRGEASPAAARPEKEPARPSRQMAVGMIRTPGMWQTLTAGGLVLAALDLLLVFLPVWAGDRGIGLATVGWMLALRAGMTLLVRLFVDRVIRVVGQRGTMMGSILVAGLGLALLPLVDLPGALVLMVVLGVGLGLAQPLTMSLVADMAAPGTQGAAMGLRLTANRLAQMLLPIGVGSVGSGADGVFWGTAVLLGAASTALLGLPGDRRARR